MAFTMNTANEIPDRLIILPVGNKRESYLEGTFTAAATTVDMGLSWIEYAEIHPVDATEDITVVCYRNAATTTEGGTPGSVHLTGVAGSKYQVRAVGW